MTTSAWRAISTAADCRSLVGLQTVSRKRTSECGNRRSIRSTRCRLFQRLRRLGRHAEAWMPFEREDVIVFEHDVEPFEIAGEAAHFEIIALPDDDDVVALAREGRDGTVRDVDERAGGFDHRQPESAGLREGPRRRAVGGHHQCRRLDVCDVLRDRDAFRLEGGQDRGIVDEVAEDREGAGISVLERERDGIANAEAHAEVGRSDDMHTFQYKVISFLM